MPVVEYGTYTFEIVKDPDEKGRLRIYVLEQPDYDDHDDSPHIIHRWSADRDGIDHPPYICIWDGWVDDDGDPCRWNNSDASYDISKDRRPRTLDAAIGRAHDWADRTDIYIETGVSISDQIASE
jgi:hypothetical protein